MSTNVPLLNASNTFTSTQNVSQPDIVTYSTLPSFSVYQIGYSQAFGLTGSTVNLTSGATVNMLNSFTSTTFYPGVWMVHIYMQVQNTTGTSSIYQMQYGLSANNNGSLTYDTYSTALTACKYTIDTTVKNINFGSAYTYPFYEHSQILKINSISQTYYFYMTPYIASGNLRLMATTHVTFTRMG